MTTWLRGGVIVDGSGGAPFIGHIGIRGDRITAVVPGVLPDDVNEIDCTGLVITPGFIDIHTHSDASYLLHSSPTSKIMQGVTTEVVGNCGFSAFPINPRRRGALEQFLRGLGISGIKTTWTDFDGYATALAATQPITNVAPLVGHGALRIAEIGADDRAVTPDRLARMITSLHAALEQGAFGMSSGLTYVPSCFADAAEIHALAVVLQQHDALYATHSRALPGFDTFDEAIDVGRSTGVRVQFSHIALNDPRMWGRANEVLGRFNAAAADGVDVKYDIYPYDASASALTQYLPSWAQENGECGLGALLDDKEAFQRACDDLARGLFGTIPWEWDRVMISLAGGDDAGLAGQVVSHAAAERGVTPEQLCVWLCARYGNQVQVTLFYRMDADVAAFLADPLAVIGSDGSALPVTTPGCPHPRNFGAHARLLQRYVRERGGLTFPDAVHKSTKAAAERLGIRDRGLITPGAYADLAVLHLPAIRETATWTQPCRLAQGVQRVWVNGEQVIVDGELTSARPGQVLRRD